MYFESEERISLVERQANAILMEKNRQEVEDIEDVPPAELKDVAKRTYDELILFRDGLSKEKQERIPGSMNPIENMRTNDFFIRESMLPIVIELMGITEEVVFMDDYTSIGYIYIRDNSKNKIRDINFCLVIDENDDGKTEFVIGYKDFKKARKEANSNVQSDLDQFAELSSGQIIQSFIDYAEEFK